MPRRHSREPHCSFKAAWRDPKRPVAVVAAVYFPMVFVNGLGGKNGFSCQILWANPLPLLDFGLAFLQVFGVSVMIRAAPAGRMSESGDFPDHRHKYFASRVSRVMAWAF